MNCIKGYENLIWPKLVTEDRMWIMRYQICDGEDLFPLKKGGKGLQNGILDAVGGV